MLTDPVGPLACRPHVRGLQIGDACVDLVGIRTLYYGGFDGTEDTTTAVGREVVTALERAGLPTRWDGNPGTAIEVTPLDWRKRLVG